MSLYTDLLVKIEDIQRRMSQAFDKHLLAEYVDLEKGLSNNMLDNDGLTIDDTLLLLKVFPEDKAQRYFLTALFASRHSFNAEYLSKLIANFPNPVFDTSLAMLLQVSGGFKSAKHYQILLEWVLDQPYPARHVAIMRELVYKYFQTARRRNGIPESLSLAANLVFLDPEDFSKFYDYVRNGDLVALAPSLLLAHPLSLSRDAALIRKLEASGSTDIQSSVYLKARYSISPEVVANIIDKGSKSSVLDIMTLSSFKAKSFSDYEVCDSDSEPQRVLYAFTRPKHLRLAALESLDAKILSRCFQHHFVFARVCHQALETGHEDAVSKLVLRMIESLVYLLSLRSPMCPNPQDDADITQQVLGPMGAIHLDRLRMIKPEMYFALKGHEAIIKESAPGFWTAFSNYRNWKNAKIRDSIFSRDLGL